MKHVKLFEAFSTPKPLTEEQISWLDKCAGGSWNLNPSTGLVDVDGSFDCSSQGLKDFKGVAFGHVKGNFYCINNQLTSLKGAPETVDEYFHCANNQLTSLVGAPQSVGESFYCTDNQLTSLDGAPKTVDGYFYCNNNQLTSLDGAPESIGKSFLCDNNQLTSLDGAPKTVNGIFYCANNQLTSLEGAPQTVDGRFDCSSNPISEKTLASIFALMKNGKSYQQALEEFWPKMGHEDRTLMYKDHHSLAQEEIRRYDALTTVNRIKNYL